ncbi:unnamed protein product [Allacma fusca]|uniref:Major facilitator superfamily (MFS) profile domain-containing protein n=1 Tax=Allacma fusca TaxID=39272 RepID=A0A8J2JBN4_9HEXA|nr:unnamed protein product [Allacma fusca]
MAAVLSFSSTALPSLRDDSKIGPEVTQVLEDWIASVPFLACALGTFICRYLAQTKGLKRSLQIIGVPLLFGWVLIALTQNVFMLLAGGLSLDFASQL